MMQIPEGVAETMVAHARDCYPEEACGLVAADANGAIQIAYPMTNIEKSRTRYTIDPTEHFYALRHSEARDWSLVAVFHSHPHTEASPSATDVELALEPNWLYVIVSLADPAAPNIRGFWITSEGVSEERLEISG